MPERVTLPGLDDLVGEPERLELELLAREPGFLALRESALTAVSSTSRRFVSVSSRPYPPALELTGQDVCEPHERDELEQLGGCVLQPDPAAVPLRGDLQPREGVDGHRVRVDPSDVADGDLRAAAIGEKGADAVAEAGQVGTGDGAADLERDRVRPGGGHRL